MHIFDMVIRNARVVTAADIFYSDIGIRDGRITALGLQLPAGEKEIDAAGRYVTPGGIDSHVHFDQPSEDGSIMADDFLSGTVSAACGGTTTVIPFACQQKGRSLREAVSYTHLDVYKRQAQDIHMRGSFLKHGIDINKDVQFINIPNPSDHVQALRRGEVELVTSVEPFATQIQQVKAAKFFDYPYDQAAGKLTNLIVTRPDVIKNNRTGVLETVRAIVKVNELMSSNKQLFIDTIQKVTGLDKAVAQGAVANLYPDYDMHRASAVAVAQMMRNLKYINTDVSETVEKNMDYSFLETVTGKPKSELGY